MIKLGNLSHIGVAVPDLNSATARLVRLFGARASAPKDVPEQGVRMVYVEVGTTTIELLTPTRLDSPIANFLERNPAGGIHHISFGVADAAEAAEGARAAGLRILGSGEPVAAHHGRPIFFLHPKDVLGALIEIEQEPAA